MNICRPITFYNNFVPPTTLVQKWEYEALGYYDGIDVGENIIKDKNIIEDETIFSFAELWGILEEKAEEFCGCYNAQTLYAFRAENEDNKIKDLEFWKKVHLENGVEIFYPFLFIMMIRLNLSSDKVNQFRKEIETGNYGKNLLIITYLSLDNNDVMVMVKSKRYEDAAEFISRLHYNNSVNDKENPPVIYDSFSVCGIKKEYINSSELNLFDENQKIEKICIRVIEKAPGTTDIMKKELNTYFEGKVKTYPALGCEDEIFLLEDIPEGKFWEIYKDSSGILSNSNEEIYQQSVFGMTTLILLSEESRKEQEIHLNIRGEKKKKVKKMCQELRDEFLKIGLNKKNREKMYLKAILQIINSLQKYESMDYVDYTYILLYFPMKMLLDLIKKEIENQGEGKEELTEILYGISDFFYAINLLAQNSIRLERQFIQSVDLNARIYEAPVQLNAFYAAYFSLLRDILNEGVGEGYNYEFMICPGVVEYLNVRRVLPRASRKKRLLLVEIPEHQIYDVKNQLMVMAHETAHFVGRDIRCREYRHKLMVKAIVKSVSTFLILDKEMHIYCTEKSIKKFEENYFLALWNEIEEYYKGIEDNKVRIREDRYHTEYMREDLWVCAQSVLFGKEELLDEIGKNALEEFGQNNEWSDLGALDKFQKLKEFKLNFLENKKTFLIRATIPEITLSDECCINNIVDSNIHLMKEAFADIISVLLLQLFPEEYIESLFDSFEQMEELHGHVRMIEWRIAFVIRAMMNSSNRNMKTAWELDNLKRIARVQLHEGQKNLMCRIIYLLENYLLDARNIFELYQEDEEREENEKIFGEIRGINRLYNKEISDIFIMYLEECCRKFYDKEKRGIYKKEELKELRKIWTSLKKVENVDDYIIKIRSFIEKYEEKWILELN